ncbi:MAG: phosphoribosylformylglycinamidine synthase subunit PurS [Candidatus Odinarchaeota archaeon]
MNEYIIEVVIESKPYAKDPEGMTIMRDLMHKAGYELINSVRTGKFLRIKVSANNAEEAKNYVVKMINDLRLYNPVAHTYSMVLKESTS